MKLLKRAWISAAVVTAFVLTPVAHAGAIHDTGLFSTAFPANDDSSVGPVSLGFTINFFGLNTAGVYVNNNGNVTFSAPLSTFTPFPIVNNSISMLAPFFADVDTRGAGNSLTTYGSAMLAGHNVFGVNWVNVGYFSQQTNKLNSFQLIITDRSDIAAGDFDFEFNYDQILWETGGASGGTNGLGGSSARAGWTNGSNTSYEFAGSAVNGAFLDNGPNALIASSLNSATAGQYVFNVRNGAVVPPGGELPEPASLGLVALALAGASLVRRKPRRT